MNKFEIGDRVSFINEKQDGVITKILPNGNYMVEIEDGFELETTASELLKIPASKQKQSYSNDIVKEDKQLKIETQPELRKLLPGLSDCVSLVLMPSNANAVLTGAVNYYLVNATKYDVLYSFSYKIKKQLIGIISGKLEGANEVFLGEISRDVLMDSESLQVQLLFHQKGFFNQLPVLTKELSIEYPDLNLVNKKINGAAAFSKINTLISFVQTPEEDLSELLKKYQDDQSDSLAKHESTKQYLNKPKEHFENANVSPGYIEVDLHIEELVEDASGMSSAEMLQIQLQHFRKAIDDAMYRRAHKITFIHGVGNGKLKNAIRAEINSIPSLHFKDAPYEKFGAGATEVFLK